MRELTLHNGMKTIVDNDDYGWLSLWKWYACHTDSWRVTRNVHRRRTKSTHFIMAREIMKHHGYDISDKIVDHKNRNTLDNRKENLRICDSTLNQANGIKRKRRCSSSRYKGVVWHKRDCIWSASISFRNKRYSLGYHKKEIDAAKAYDRKAIELFGEFARTNIIKQ